MSIYSFKYLDVRRLFIFLIMIFVTSMLFSFTNFYFLGYYETINSYLGEDENILAVYDRQSSTPLTGLVPLSLVYTLRSINGVLNVSAEIILPIMIGEAPVFLRGTVPDDFRNLVNMELVSGKLLELDDFGYAIVGEKLASRLDLNVEDWVILFSSLKPRYIELKIKGIFSSATSIDDEILVSIYAGQWLRGTDYGHATLIRVEIDNTKTSTDVLWAEIENAINNTEPGDVTSNSGQPDLSSSFTWGTFDLDGIAVKDVQNFMEDQLGQYGVTVNTLLILSIIVFVFSTTGAFVALRTLQYQHRHELTALRSIGASSRSLKIDWLLKILPYSTFISLIGVTASSIVLFFINKYAQLQAFSHTIDFQVEPFSIVLNVILSLFITTIAIIWGRWWG